jgi:hypothetical protein
MEPRRIASPGGRLWEVLQRGVPLATIERHHLYEFTRDELELYQALLLREIAQKLGAL